VEDFCAYENLRLRQTSRVALYAVPHLHGATHGWDLQLLPIGSPPASWMEALGDFASFFLLPQREVLPSELFIGLRAGRLSCP